MSEIAPSVVFQWIPEDDLRLKNAVEHGASLEALAKGAVRFSRKFSVEQLRHRWYSLLYDPDISADASSRMVEMEHYACNTSSKLNRSGNSKENEDVSLKRRIESVQQLYYSIRKKTCHQPLNSEIPVNMNVGDEDQGVGRSVVPDGVREQGSRLDCSVEDELIYGKADGKHTVNKKYYNSIDSLLSTSPNDVNGNKVLNGKEAQTAPNANFATSAGISAEELEVEVGPSHSTPGNQLVVCHSEAIVPPSTSYPNPDFPKPHDRVLNCTLNIEDPEIPCNDDVLVLRPFTTSLASIVSKVSSNHTSVFPNSEGCDQLHMTSREEISSKSLVTSWIPESYPETCKTLPLATQGIKSEFPDSNCCHMFSRIAPRNRSQLRSALANPSFSSEGVFDGSLSSRYSLDSPFCAIATIKHLLRPKATLPPTTDHEESDDDIPCFSDIEAMILQMDLSPDDEDSNVLEIVSRYQHDDTRRKIIRLEQCAQSSMQRAIASKGALAILHGRRLKYYIKEIEVILGRTTDETDVDIDLRREGCANKISRRQALVRMGEDGSFFLKNLGRSSMFVNGKEVTTGQHMNLSPSCLIEIRELAFVFDINHKSVTRYLANASSKNKGKNANFEWSEEGVP